LILNNFVTYTEIAMRWYWIAAALAAGAVVGLAADDGSTMPPAVSVASAAPGRMLLTTGRIRDAERYTRMALASSSDDALLALWGEIQFRRGDFNEAAKAFASAIEFNHLNARAFWGLGRVAEVHFRHTEARDYFAAAYRLDPRDTRILHSYLECITDSKARNVLLRNLVALSRDSNPDLASQAAAQLEIDRRLAGKPASRLASGNASYRVPLSAFRPAGAVQDGLAVTVRINDGKPLRLVLDTGARGILIDSRAAKNLGLEPIVSSQLNGFGESETGESHLALARSLAVGDLRFEDCLILVNPRSVVAGADGILGAGLFEDFRVRIDAGRQAMDLTPVSDTAGMGSPDNVVGSRNLLLLRTAVSGQEGWFLLDSGAAYSTLDRDLVPPILRKGPAGLVGVRGTLEGAYRLGPVRLDVVGRSLVDMAPVALDLGPLSNREGIEISGVLGYSALSRRPFTIDFRHGSVTFE
jgi:tetratricopeptide (TPR) repeat protein